MPLSLFRRRALETRPLALSDEAEAAPAPSLPLRRAQIFNVFNHSPRAHELMMSRRFLRFDAIAFTGVPGLTYGKGRNRNRYLLASAPTDKKARSWRAEIVAELAGLRESFLIRTPAPGEPFDWWARARTAALAVGAIYSLLAL